MRLRREDDRLELTATLVTDGSGKQVATMTSIPKAGIGAEDLLGAIVKLEDPGVTGIVMYVTLTSSTAVSRTVGGKTVHMLIGTGTVSNMAGTGGLAGTITFLHTEMGETIDEGLMVSMPKTASDGS